LIEPADAIREKLTSPRTLFFAAHNQPHPVDDPKKGGIHSTAMHDSRSVRVSNTTNLTLPVLSISQAASSTINLTISRHRNNFICGSGLFVFYKTSTSQQTNREFRSSFDSSS
jgi:hypothetical protein